MLPFTTADVDASRDQFPYQVVQWATASAPWGAISSKQFNCDSIKSGNFTIDEVDIWARRRSRQRSFCDVKNEEDVWNLRANSRNFKLLSRSIWDAVPVAWLRRERLQSLHIFKLASEQVSASCGPQSKNLRPASTFSEKIYIFKTITIIFV